MLVEDEVWAEHRVPFERGPFFQPCDPGAQGPGAADSGASLLPSLGPLVGKVKECQVETIVDALCANMRSDKEQLRDIAGIGLKTVLSELPPAATGTQHPAVGTLLFAPAHD